MNDTKMIQKYSQNKAMLKFSKIYQKRFYAIIKCLLQLTLRGTSILFKKKKKYLI